MSVLADGWITRFIQRHQVGVDRPVGESAQLSGLFLLLQRIDQFDGGQEPDALALVPVN